MNFEFGSITDVILNGTWSHTFVGLEGKWVNMLWQTDHKECCLVNMMPYNPAEIYLHPLQSVLWETHILYLSHIYCHQ